jgi:UDP-GlcNAc:undecaprenyl-phosphate GlcNAc-1-phosphate transferase
VGDATAEPLVGVGLSAVLMFVVGVIDDIRHLRPQLKFILQTLAGVVLVNFGGLLPLTPWYGANVVVTLFWFVGVTNAFNLLDNMDGIAAGVAALAAGFLGITFITQGAWSHAAIAWAVGGAALGFLRYNFPPASIFMGDAGSLFLGSALAGLAVASPTAASGSLVSVLFVPLTIVAVPVLDTALVTITRTLAGQPISQGGRDHSAHRLVALGLGEWQVAVLLYGFATVCGLVALLLTGLDRGLGMLLGTGFLIAMGLLAAYLGRLQVAQPGKGRQPPAVTLLVGTLLYKRRLVELMLDVALVTIAYYGAFRLRFDGALPLEYATAFDLTLGLVIAAKVAAFGLFGVYRGTWQYASLGDLHRILGAVLLGSAMLLVYSGWRVPALAHSRGIIYIDALLTAGLVVASRLSFRSLEMLRRWLQLGGERVLIYGAGDRGELVLRELLNDRTLDMQPACFLDDDPRKHGVRIHGVPIVGGAESLALAVRQHGISKIVIATKKLPADIVTLVRAFTARQGVPLVELELGFRLVSPPAPESRRQDVEHAGLPPVAGAPQPTGG